MAKYTLNITIPVDSELDELGVSDGIKELLGLLSVTGMNNVHMGLDFYQPKVCVNEIAKVSLTRDGDRSGGNLLLPKLDGRLGKHYQGKKANLKDIFQ